ncbi:hypothetical protein [Falsiroseomonas sp. E2-1-a20]|uniref:hypothetical protein n=1 Tax=Falsiroseomonas sp. E2-1-a20 TaxID=3239300 RepID=UPI003F3505EF
MQRYHFFSWVRRGLGSSLAPAAGGPPARGTAELAVGITLAGENITQIRRFLMLGPGDVLGLDPRLIVRQEPRPGTRDFEPNMLAAVEFDPPDLPWIVATTQPEQDQLRPWLVLVVLDRDRVPGVRVRPGRPLPYVEVPDGELPDLTQSWAWAHGQRLALDGGTGDAAEMARRPELNVSRLVCPRRLVADRRWLACVVPAWDAGRRAGLGEAAGNPDAPLTEAWQPGQAAILPVYHHWEFETGEDGDFEVLARRLTPAPATIPPAGSEEARRGLVWLGAADGRADTLAALPPGGDRAEIRQEAPLEVPGREVSPQEVPQAFVEAVRRATTPAEPGPDGLAELLPPLHGAAHVRRDAADPARMGTAWFDELNLDPRTRIAARLGADTVRRTQEDLMQAAWEQVGEVLAANAQLDRGRLAALVNTRLVERHVRRLRPERVLAITSVLHARTFPVRTGQPAALTVAGEIARTSLPDRAFDAAARRLASPAGRLMRLAERSLAARDLPAAGARHAASRGLAAALLRSEASADPSLRGRDGLTGFSPAEEALRQGITEIRLGREVIGMDRLREGGGALDRADRPRADLGRIGVLPESRIAEFQSFAAAQGTGLAEVVGQVAEMLAVAPRAAAVALQREGGTQRLVALEPTQERGATTLSIVDAAGRRQELLTAVGSGVRDIAGAVEVARSASVGLLDAVREGRRATVTERMEGGSSVLRLRLAEAVVPQRVDERRFDFRTRRRAGTAETTIPRGGAADILLRGREVARERRDIPVFDVGGDTTPLFDTVLALPERDPAAVRRVELAFSRLELPPVVPAAVLRGVPDGLPALAERLRAAIHPPRVIGRRLGAQIAIPGWLGAGRAPLDPIMAAPELRAPLADLLAAFAPDQMLPRELSLPPDGVAALEANNRFIAAFMVGANHELNRELLWRIYPTDGRGTSLTRFWNWRDPARLDCRDIHAWPAGGPLAARLASGEARIALVLRGNLLRRYPGTQVLAWKAGDDGKLVQVNPAQPRDTLRETLFRLRIEPDITVVGLDIGEEELRADPRWRFVVQEPTTEPRFGLDAPETPSGGRRRGFRGQAQANDLNWQQTATPPGQHLDPARVPGAGQTAAALAGLLLQRPVRVLIAAAALLPEKPG